MALLDKIIHGIVLSKRIIAFIFIQVSTKALELFVFPFLCETISKCRNPS